MDAFWTVPPITRTLVAATFIVSVLVHTLKLLSEYYIAFLPSRILRLQLWRLITPFLLTNSGLGVIFDSYTYYLYGSFLETESSRFREPGSFVTYLLFIGGTIIALCYGLFGAVFYGPVLVLALAWTYAQDNPNRQITFFIVTFQAKWLPLAMLAVTFFAASPQAALFQAMGIPAAHLHDFLTRIWPTFGGGRQRLQTPHLLRRWFGGTSSGAQSRGYGTVYDARPATQQPQSSPRGWSSAFSSGPSNVWGSRGAGRRLGGD